MAKQAGNIKLVGCIQNLQFYKMEGKYYVRKKSSLTGRRVKTDKAFTLTMAYADLLKIASPIASKVYLQLPKGERDNKFRRKLVGLAMQLFKQGMTVDDIYEQLYNQTFPSTKPTETILEIHPMSAINFADEILNRIFSNVLAEPESTQCVFLGTLPP
jgi:Tfp pilus assembly protein PilZ